MKYCAGEEQRAGGGVDCEGAVGNCTRLKFKF